MKKIALVFVVAVLAPSLVLAWLAVRSLRDQQFLLERQQSLLYQGVADALARQLQDALAGYQAGFKAETAKLLRENAEVARSFDDQLRQDWPLAQVGFVVTLDGDIVSPSPNGRPEARKFLGDNGGFLASRESAEVYWNPKQIINAPPVTNAAPPSSWSTLSEINYLANNRAQMRNVVPQQQAVYSQKPSASEDNQQQLSKVAVASAEFRQLIGEETEGTLARFVNNKLAVLVWCRPSISTPKAVTKGASKFSVSSPAVSPQVFGAQLSLPRLIEALRPMITPEDPALRDEICVALLDDAAKPVALSRPGFQANWKRPFVATEIGEILPHWEVALYLLNPAKLTRLAQTLKLTLGLLIAVMLLAIGVGSWLIVADLSRQLTLARQKTDFVSNVSHELKTPLTSIRMFSELLAEGRVTNPAKQRSYLGIITAESARLTRLINNVLDFARLERGQKKYDFEKCDLVGIAREVADTYRPHLEAGGFQFECELPESGIEVNGDHDALAQVVVNLLSNAEKYSDGGKQIGLRVRCQRSPLPYGEVQVLDRGPGVPRGCEEKIFEQFYRAHDSLSSGIQGSGLGLTLARQIARAHNGEVVYERREGGGSCFSLRLPLCGGEDVQSPKPKAQR